MLPIEIHTIIASYLNNFVDLDNFTVNTSTKLNYIELIRLNFTKYYHPSVYQYNTRIIYIDLLLIRDDKPHFEATIEYLCVNDLMDIENAELIKYDNIKLFEVVVKRVNRGPDWSYVGIMLNYTINRCWKVVKYIAESKKLDIHSILNAIKAYDTKVFTDDIMLELVKYIKFEEIINDNFYTLLYWPINCTKSFQVILNKIIITHFDVDIFIHKLRYGHFSDPIIFKSVYEKYKHIFRREHLIKILKLYKKLSYNRSHQDTNINSIILYLKNELHLK
jgi:hypothetical protein